MSTEALQAVLDIVERLLTILAARGIVSENEILEIAAIARRARRGRREA